MKCNKCSNANICLVRVEYWTAKYQLMPIKLRSMSDEESAEWINSKDTCEQCAYTPGGLCMRKPCTNGILKWLQSEAE